VKANSYKQVLSVTGSICCIKLNGFKVFAIVFISTATKGRLREYYYNKVWYIKGEFRGARLAFVQMCVFKRIV
jgi:hypothetical protein